MRVIARIVIVIKRSDMEQSYKEKYEYILARLERAKNDNEVCDERFCCVINEIIPELAESEDEKVRKALKQYFVNSFKNNGVAAICGVHVKDVLAWLEKQGETSPVLSNSSNIGKDEQKPVEENKGNIGGISSNSALSEENEPQKKLVESYLAKFDKKFPILPTLKGKQLADYKNFLNKCQQIFGLKYWGIHPTQAKLFEKLSLLWAAWGAEHLQGLGQTDGDMDNEISMWSEEDEKEMAAIEHHLNNCGASITSILWLKSLKGRVGCEANCTTTKEWSEEDEHRIKDTVYFLDTAKKHYASTEELDACIDWLKSLRPQNHWKPTDEQIDLLQAIINEPKNATSESCQIVLKDTLEQLKKLKKEQA